MAYRKFDQRWGREPRETKRAKASVVQTYGTALITLAAELGVPADVLRARLKKNLAEWRKVGGGERPAGPVTQEIARGIGERPEELAAMLGADSRRLGSGPARA